MSLIGARVLRKEDPNLITGQGRYVDDLQPAGCAFMAVVRSTEPHARISSIDASAAKAIPGVLAVWTGTDVAHLPARPSSLPGMDMPLIATDVARFVGDIVAVVVADGPVDTVALQQHVAETLSVHKRPREVRVVDQLPRNAMGKVQKHLLR